MGAFRVEEFFSPPLQDSISPNENLDLPPLRPKLMRPHFSLK